MDKRMEELLKLRCYTEEIDKDLTMILQSLQWDRKHILQHPTMVSCIYDSNHKVLQDKIKEHEEECILRHNGYTKDDCFLPDPPDPDSKMLIKLSKDDITHIIDNAAQLDPSFKKVHIDTVHGLSLYISGGLEPQTLSRLQCAYSSDERRAIHDAVVSAAPSCHDLADLALTGVGEDDQAPKVKSRTEILAELRDMRRRRTKYRVAAKSRNYSDVLRDVIKTQMEHYNDAVGNTVSNTDEEGATTHKQTHSDRHVPHATNDDREKFDRRREFSRRDDIHRDKERSRRSDRDRRKSRHEREVFRSTDDSRERYYSRNEKDQRIAHGEVKKEDDSTRRERYRVTRERYISKERRCDETSDISYKHRDRSHDRHKDRSKRGQQESSRKRYNEEYRGDKYDKEKRKEQDRVHDDAELADLERARNLLVEIKREMDSEEDNESLDIGGDKERYKEKSRHRQDRDEIQDRKHTYSYRYSEKEYDSHVKRKSKDGRSERHREQEESDYRNKRSKKDDRAERDRRSDEKVKKSQTEEKHRMYSELYLELTNRRNKKESK